MKILNVKSSYRCGISIEGTSNISFLRIYAKARTSTFQTANATLSAILINLCLSLLVCDDIKLHLDKGL